jgi:hypothetical protein
VDAEPKAVAGVPGRAGNRAKRVDRGVRPMIVGQRGKLGKLGGATKKDSDLEWKRLSRVYTRSSTEPSPRQFEEDSVELN